MLFASYWVVLGWHMGRIPLNPLTDYFPIEKQDDYGYLVFSKIKGILLLIDKLCQVYASTACRNSIGISVPSCSYWRLPVRIGLGRTIEKAFPISSFSFHFLNFHPFQALATGKS